MGMVPSGTKSLRVHGLRGVSALPRTEAPQRAEAFASAAPRHDDRPALQSKPQACACYPCRPCRHRAAPSIGAIDLHADTPLWMRWFGYDVLREHTPAIAARRMARSRRCSAHAQGRLRGAVLRPGEHPDDRHGLGERDRRTDRRARTSGECVGWACSSARARTPTSSRRERQGGSPRSWASRVRTRSRGASTRSTTLRAAAFGYLGLLHFSTNAAGFPAYGKGRDDDAGLTDFGVSVVQRCNDLGVIVDLAHINRRGFFHALEQTRGPVIVSHTGVAGVQAHWRNLPDDQIRAVADRGGVVGIMFAPRFLGRDGVDAVVDHIEHVVRVAGEDTPALGSDWDGVIIPTKGLRDSSELPNLLDALRARMPEAVVEKIARAQSAARPARCAAASPRDGSLGVTGVAGFTRLVMTLTEISGREDRAR